MMKQRRTVREVVLWAGLLALVMAPISRAQEAKPAETWQEPPWCNKYCMSFFTKTRTSKILGKGHYSLALKTTFNDFDDFRGSDGEYHHLQGEDDYEKITTTFCAKYGWRKGHMIALGIPFFWNDNDHKDHLDTNGFANVFIFEKWNLMPETQSLPGVSVDAWYYFTSGDSNRMGAGNHSWKFTAGISKAWNKVSFHLNPAYRTGSSGGPHMIEGNAAIMYQPCKKLWPAVEYNYFRKEGKGSRHDIVPGIIWKFRPGCSFKLAPVITVHTTEPYRDRIGGVMKLFVSF